MARLPFDIADIEARLRDDAPAHLEPDAPTWRDDLADMIADVRAQPGLAAVTVCLGFITGVLSTVGLAFVWAWWAL